MGITIKIKESQLKKLINESSAELNEQPRETLNDVLKNGGFRLSGNSYMKSGGNGKYYISLSRPGSLSPRGYELEAKLPVRLTFPIPSANQDTVGAQVPNGGFFYDLYNKQESFIIPLLKKMIPLIK